MSRSARPGSAWKPLLADPPPTTTGVSEYAPILVRYGANAPVRLAYRAGGGWRVSHVPWTAGERGSKGVFMEEYQLIGWEWMEISK